MKQDISLYEQAKKYRKQIADIVHNTKKGHIGGCYSCIDVLTMLYLGGLIRINPQNPKYEGRDKFLLSKGHCALALYVVLADMGIISDNDLMSFGKNGSFIAPHTDYRVDGVEISAGSLGNGLGIGVGMALADINDKLDKRNIVVLTGDGECNEGSVWEAAMYAGAKSLHNLIWIIDRNRQAVLDFTEDAAKLNPLADKIKAFNWQVIEIDGHNYEELEILKDNFFNLNRQKPLCVIANTVKGKGVSFMEGKLEWHHKALSDELYKKAISELEKGALFSSEEC